VIEEGVADGVHAGIARDLPGVGDRIAQWVESILERHAADIKDIIARIIAEKASRAIPDFSEN